MLGDLDQLAVCEFFSALRAGFLHGMTGKETGRDRVACLCRKGSASGEDLSVARGSLERTRHKCHEAVQLPAGHRELFNYFLDAHASFQVFKQNLHWRSSFPQHPSAADFTGDAFDDRAL
jgi:hypothetical protein